MVNTILNNKICVGIKKGFNCDYYLLTIDEEKLDKIKKEILENCSTKLNKKLLMHIDYSNNEKLVIKNSIRKTDKCREFGDYIYYENECVIYNAPAVVDSINALLKEKDLNKINDIFVQINENNIGKHRNIIQRLLDKAIDSNDRKVMDSCSRDLKNMEVPRKFVNEYKNDVINCFKLDYLFTKPMSFKLIIFNKVPLILNRETKKLVKEKIKTLH